VWIYKGNPQRRSFQRWRMSMNTKVRTIIAHPDGPNWSVSEYDKQGRYVRTNHGEYSKSEALAVARNGRAQNKRRAKKKFGKIPWPGKDET
jgi:hypothetical protein